jgi:carbohydrate-selective porin OprB
MLPTYDAEKAFELNYMVQAKPWLVLQPAVQYYANLGTNSCSGNAAVAGSVLRLRSDPRHRKEGFNEDPARSIPEH